MKELLVKKGYSFNTLNDNEVIREIKEKIGYVVNNYEDSFREANENHGCDKIYDLPDGRKIMLGTERFKAPEILFNPSLNGLEQDGLHKYCFDSIMRCEVENRRDLF